MKEKLVELRHELHQFPELSGCEIRTAARVQSFLTRNAPPSRIIDLPETSFAVEYQFGDPGPTIAFRCELDALPISESNELPYKSKMIGVSHKCGHDGHMTILCGLAEKLVSDHNAKGRLILIFQHSEENGKGAYEIINSPGFQGLSIDYLFALHNIPGRPLGKVIIKERIFSPSVISFIIRLDGKVAHASEPETGINPALTIAHIINEFDKLNVPDSTSDDFRLLTPVYANMGQEAFGISAGAGSLGYTIRANTVDGLNQLKDQIARLTSSACEAARLPYDIEWFDYFPTVKNDLYCNEMILQAAKRSGLPVSVESEPFRFGEDFGWFAQHYTSGFFGMGAGLGCSPLHDSSYDFPDELIPVAISQFYSIITEVLN